MSHYCPPLTPNAIRSRVSTGRFAFTELGLEKRCSTCGEYFPADTEFFYAQAYRPEGLSCGCKACQHESKIKSGRRKQ
ncbi:MAG: hypothetical protein KKH74_01875 [Gammaproteobacteria bacterium]|nr:hypothetical protein [Gammaproteobacteria bacterium]MBU1731008.1 hypothetical protein [Gammaproteobacteria bacterium]MBU1893668.1 hypothetical protein [Gammaproteobacteria bacterium]